MTTSAPATTAAPTRSAPPCVKSMLLPTSACRPSEVELRILISHLKLYFSQKPFSLAMIACMLPVVLA